MGWRMRAPPACVSVRLRVSGAGSSVAQVEPGDKKKKARGRAAKRLIFNRRFTNVQTGPGRKRGPNSNADKATM